jgi:hypothetical protein
MPHKITKILKNPGHLFLALSARGFFNWMPDALYLKILFRLEMDRKLDLQNPQTFNEKIQWLKLYDRKPFYAQFVDKYEVRKFIAEKLGEEYLVPLLGMWDSVDDIDFEKLPNQFVLKCTHDSGSVVVCKDKSILDKKEAIRKLKKGMKRNYFWGGREWPYKDVKSRIIAEEFLIPENGISLNDYKFYSFNGDIKFLLVCSDREKGTHKKNYFNIDFKPLNIEQKNYAKSLFLEKPQNLEKMLIFGKKLSCIAPFIRIDFYEHNEKVYFGELTFYPNSGLLDWSGDLDLKFGEWLKLPTKEKYET